MNPTHAILGLIALAGAAAAYYFLIHKKKAAVIKNVSVMPPTKEEMLKVAAPETKNDLQTCFTAPYAQRPWVKAGGDQSAFYKFANPNSGTIVQEDMCQAWYKWISRVNA